MRPNSVLKYYLVRSGGVKCGEKLLIYFVNTAFFAKFALPYRRRQPISISANDHPKRPALSWPFFIN